MRAQAGLTLLEMMVVLMIAGMALALGFQSLGQWRRANTAIAGITGEVRETMLVEDWFRSSIRGLEAVAETPFEGDASSFAGLTLQPVLASQGGAMPIRWRLDEIDGDSTLQLAEGERTISLPLHHVENAAFAYMDSDGAVHDRWPPALGLHENLPASVLLRLQDDTGKTRLWAAAIVGARNPVSRPYEAEED